MSTVNDIVARALELAHVTQEGETPDAADAAKGLTSFNRMLHSWGIDYGVDLGHADLVLTDTITLPDSHLSAVEHNLAIRMATEFESAVDQATVVFAARGLRALQSIYINVPELGFDRAFRNRVSTRSGGEKF